MSEAVVPANAYDPQSNETRCILGIFPVDHSGFWFVRVVFICKEIGY